MCSTDPSRFVKDPDFGYQEFSRQEEDHFQVLRVQVRTVPPCQIVKWQLLSHMLYPCWQFYTSSSLETMYSVLKGQLDCLSLWIYLTDPKYCQDVPVWFYLEEDEACGVHRIPPRQSSFRLFCACVGLLVGGPWFLFGKPPLLGHRAPARRAVPQRGLVTVPSQS